MSTLLEPESEKMIKKGDLIHVDTDHPDWGRVVGNGVVVGIPGETVTLEPLGMEEALVCIGSPVYSNLIIPVSNISALPIEEKRDWRPLEERHLYLPLSPEEAKELENLLSAVTKVGQPGLITTLAHLKEARIKQLDPQLELLRRAAYEQHHKEGEVEIDESALMSNSEKFGAYVQAWIWVEI